MHNTRAWEKDYHQPLLPLISSFLFAGVKSVLAPQFPQESAGFFHLLPKQILAELDYIAQAGILVSLMVC